MRLDGAEAGGAGDRAAQAGAEADRVSAIREAILLAVAEQRLPPGTKPREDQLAAHFAVSRTLVRGPPRPLAELLGR